MSLLLVGSVNARIGFLDGVFWRNGEPIEEPYARRREDWRLEDVTLGENDYFLVGDNRSMPMAQHDFGTSTRDRLIGPRAF